MAKVNKINLNQSKSSGENLDNCIRKKAYELWEKKGRISGKDLEIWLEAEKIVKAGKK